MKYILTVALLSLVLFIGAGIDDVLGDMKTTKPAVQDFIQSSFGYGMLSYPSACSAIPEQKRASVVRSVGEFAKAFTATDLFKKWYSSFRDGRKPASPEQMPLAAEARSRQVAEIKKQLAEQEEARASAPADQKAMYNDIVKALKDVLKQVEKVDKSQDAQMDIFVRQANEQSMKEYKEKLAAFEAEFPEGNPKPLVKRRLQRFLDLTKDVDFQARLVKKGDVMVFVKEEYENKDAAWKMAFRAGREAVEAGRAFAGSWLKEL